MAGFIDYIFLRGCQLPITIERVFFEKETNFVA